MRLSFPNFLISLRVLLKCFTRVSALASVAFSVFISRAAYCSTDIDVNSVTNRYFADYADFIAFRDAQVADVESALGFATQQFRMLYSLQHDVYVLSDQCQEVQEYSSSLSTDYGQYTEPRDGYESEYALLWNDIDNTSSTVNAIANNASDMSNKLSHIELQLVSTTNDLHTIRSALDEDVPTYQIVVNQSGGMSTNIYYTSVTNIYIGSSGGAGGGCNCPDYTSLLTSIDQRLGNIQFQLSALSDNVYYLYNLSFGLLYALAEYTGHENDWSDETEIGYFAGMTLGQVLSNAWASASPDSFLHRSQRYSQYIDNDAPIDLEPEPQEVAADVPLVAIIGLLYRIQHKLYQTNVADVVTGWRDDEQRQVEEKEEEAEETSAGISLDDVPEMPSSAIPFSDLFHVFELLNTALDNILRNLPDIQIGTIIVVDSDGFDVNLGSGAATDVNSRPLHFSPGPPSEDSSALARGFIMFLSGLFAVVWYALGGLVALLLSQWLFKLLVSSISLAFSVIGGDFSTAVRLLERFGSHFAGGS